MGETTPDCSRCNVYTNGVHCTCTLCISKSTHAHTSRDRNTDLIGGRHHLDVIAHLEEFAQFADVEIERVATEKLGLCAKRIINNDDRSEESVPKKRN